MLSWHGQGHTEIHVQFSLVGLPAISWWR